MVAAETEHYSTSRSEQSPDDATVSDDGTPDDGTPGYPYEPSAQPSLGNVVRLERLNPSGYGIDIVDAPLSGAWHVLWGPTGTPWGRAEGCNM